MPRDALTDELEMLLEQGEVPTREPALPSTMMDINDPYNPEAIEYLTAYQREDYSPDVIPKDELPVVGEDEGLSPEAIEILRIYRAEEQPSEAVLPEESQMAGYSKFLDKYGEMPTEEEIRALPRQRGSQFERWGAPQGYEPIEPPPEAKLVPDVVPMPTQTEQAATSWIDEVLQDRVLSMRQQAAAQAASQPAGPMPMPSGPAPAAPPMPPQPQAQLPAGITPEQAAMYWQQLQNPPNPPTPQFPGWGQQ